MQLQPQVFVCWTVRGFELGWFGEPPCNGSSDGAHALPGFKRLNFVERQTSRGPDFLVLRLWVGQRLVETQVPECQASLLQIDRFSKATLSKGRCLDDKFQITLDWDKVP